MGSPIQSIRRCMNILTELNLRNGATIADLCAATGLSRGTAYRILETLKADGFVRKDLGSAHYWLSERVRALSDGYRDEWWIDAFARPIMDGLGRETRWPVKLLTPQGPDMVTRVTTDFDSPFTDGKYPTGFRVALLWSAAGRAFLAFCDESHREALVAAAEASSTADGLKAEAAPSFRTDGYAVVKTSRPNRHEGAPARLTDMLEQIHKDGYAVVHTTGAVFYTVAVPVMGGPAAIGAISIHVFRSVMRPAQAITAYLAPLQTAAAEIGRQWCAA